MKRYRKRGRSDREIKSARQNTRELIKEVNIVSTRRLS